MKKFKKELYTYVFGPIFLAVLILLIQNIILISYASDLALSNLEDHFKEIGIIYVQSKNLVQKTFLEVKYSSHRQNISILKSMLKKQYRNLIKKNPHPNSDVSFDDYLVRIQNRVNKYESNAANEVKYFVWNSINQLEDSKSKWTQSEQDYYANFLNILKIIPIIYRTKDFYAVDPSSKLLLGNPLRVSIPNFKESTSYNPTTLDWYKVSTDQEESKLGEFVFNKPFFKDNLLTPLCTQIDDASKQLKSVICTNLDFSSIIAKLKQGMQDQYLQQVYSYLVYPKTRQIVGATDFDMTKVETVDEFEFGSNFKDNEDYKNFISQTQFMNEDKLVEKDKDRCQFDFQDIPRKIEFVDENKDKHFLMVRSILFCEKNEQNKYNLLRVAYIGTAINRSQLNDYVLEKTMTMSITQELTLLISIFIICGFLLSVVIIGFYFTEQIFTPIENLTKGLKRLDVESIKVIFKKFEQSENCQDKSEVYLPLAAYHNLINLVSEANQLYYSGQKEESLSLFQRSQQIYNYLGNTEGDSICLHNQGVILINQNKLTEGMQMLEQSLDFCWRERFAFQQKYFCQGISEEEMLTDESYYHLLITICRRTFTLIEANLILMRQFQMGNKLKKVNAQKVIDLINDIIDIQNLLCTFGKVTSILIYAKIQLSYFYYLQDDLENSQKEYQAAEDAYDGYFPKLSYNPVNSFPLCVLHQQLLVQKGLIEEKLGHLYNAALLFTISIEEVEEYKPDVKEEALQGIQRIMKSAHIESLDVNYFLSAFDNNRKDVYFLIDLCLNTISIKQVIQTREKIIRLLCGPEDKVSQLSMADKLFMNYFKISISDVDIRLESSEKLESFDAPISQLQEGLKNIYSKISSNIESANKVQEGQFQEIYRNSISLLKPPVLNSKQLLIIFTDLSRVLLNDITDQHLKSLSENFTIIMIDFSQDYVNTDQMFNKIVLQENLNFYHYFNFNSINNTLIQQWRYLAKEPNTQFKFNMEYFQ